MFTALLNYQLDLYSTGDDQDCWKTDKITAVVHPPSRWQNIRQTPGLLVLPYYLCLLFLLF